MNSISNSFLFFVSLLAIFTLWRPVTQITKTMLSTLLKMVRWHEFNCDTRLSLILIYKQMEVTIQHIYEINLLINSESKKHQWLLSLCKSILFASLLKKRKHNPEFGALIFRSSHNHWNCNCVTIMAVYCLPKKNETKKKQRFHCYYLNWWVFVRCRSQSQPLTKYKLDFSVHSLIPHIFLVRLVRKICITILIKNILINWNALCFDWNIITILQVSALDWTSNHLCCRRIFSLFFSLSSVMLREYVEKFRKVLIFDFI